MSTIEYENMEKQDLLTEKIDQFLEGMSEGSAILVYRESPKDLAGFLEEIEIAENENPIDLQYLAKTWGGEVLKLALRDKQGKFKRTVLIPMRSYPPKMNGKAISEKDEVETFEKLEKMAKMLRGFNANHNPQPIIQQSSMPQWLPVMMPLLQTLFERLLQPPPQPPSPHVQMNEVLEALKSAKDFVSEGVEPSWYAPLIKIGEVVAEKALTQQLQPPAQVQRLPARPTQVPTPVPTPIPTPIPTPVPTPVPTLMQTPTKKAELPTDIIKNISGKQAASFFLEALEQMTENNREECLKEVFGELGLEEVDEELELRKISDI